MAAGGASTYTAKLLSKPTGAVTVSIASDNTDVTANPASLTFTAGNWSTAQTVSVSASSDSDDYADAASLTHRATGGGYGGVTPLTLAVAVAETGDTRVLAVTAATERVYRIGAETVRVTYSPLASNAVPSPAGSGFGPGGRGRAGRGGRGGEPGSDRGPDAVPGGAPGDTGRGGPVARPEACAVAP